MRCNLGLLGSLFSAAISEVEFFGVVAFTGEESDKVGEVETDDAGDERDEDLDAESEGGEAGEFAEVGGVGGQDAIHDGGGGVEDDVVGDAEEVLCDDNFK